MNRPGDEGKCSSCGAKLVFLTSPKGALIPAQKVTALYTRTENRVHKFDQTNYLEVDEFYINHFQTCPHASKHSLQRKQITRERNWNG